MQELEGGCAGPGELEFVLFGGQCKGRSKTAAGGGGSSGDIHRNSPSSVSDQACAGLTDDTSDLPAAEGRYQYSSRAQGVPALFPLPCRAAYEGKVTWRDRLVNILPAAINGSFKFQVSSSKLTAEERHFQVSGFKACPPGLRAGFKFRLLEESRVPRSPFTLHSALVTRPVPSCPACPPSAPLLLI